VFGRSKNFLPYFLPNQYPTSPPAIAATGAKVKRSGADNLAIQLIDQFP